MPEVLQVYSTGKKQSTIFAYYERRQGYRANSHRQLRRLAANAGFKLHKFDYLDQFPYALRFCPLLYRLACQYHHVVRSMRFLGFLNGWILCVLTKPDGRMKASMRYNG